MSIIRWLLRWVILFVDRITTPKSPDHPAEIQLALDEQTRKLALYEFEACPFCVKTRRAAKRLGLKIETRDAKNTEKWHNELIQEGGKYQVPCLKITDADDSATWLYESSDVIQYLNDHFAIRDEQTA